MIFQGRELDVLALWNSLGIEVPDIPRDRLPMFLPKVVCPNPAHDTHKRHFQVNTRKPVVHCFAKCGISGTYEHAVATILGLRTDKGELDERAARRAILKHTGVALRGAPSAFEGSGIRKSFDADSAVASDEKRLNNGDFQYLPANARAYLNSRGIDDSSRGKWQLGFDEDEGRIVIPAFDDRGVFRFLIRREIEGRSSLKYLYTKGVLKTSLLFGACYADKNAIRSDGLILVEGSLDTIKMHQLGLRNTVGILGSGISKKQVRLICQLRPRRIYTFFDKDVAGVENIADVRRELTKFPIFVMRYPKNRSDPAEMTKQEVERAIERALPVGEFYKRARSVRTTKEVLAAHG